MKESECESESETESERERERESTGLGLSGLGVVQEGFGPETLGGNMQRSHFCETLGRRVFWWLQVAFWVWDGGEGYECGVQQGECSRAFLTLQMGSAYKVKVVFGVWLRSGFDS